jgi:hypothetical protein
MSKIGWKSGALLCVAMAVAMIGCAAERDPSEIGTVEQAYTLMGTWAGDGSAIPVAAPRGIDGRLHLLAADAGNVLRYDLQPAPSTWAAANLTVVGATPLVIAGRAAAAPLPDGRLVVVARNGTTLFYTTQTAIDARTWTSWAALVSGATDPAIGTNQDGRLEVFYAGTDGLLHHVWENAPGGSWIGPATYPGTGAFGAPAVIRDSASQLEVYFRGQDCALWRVVQAVPNGGWFPSESLGLCIQPSPGVGMNQDGRLEVFVRQSTDGLYQRWQLAPMGAWSGWFRMPDAPARSGGIVVNQTSPAVVRNSDGRLAVYTSGYSSVIPPECATEPCASTVLIEQVVPNGTWTPWSTLDGALNTARSEITAAVNANGLKVHFSLYLLDPGYIHQRETLVP